MRKMAEKELPKIGAKIPVEKFHVSKMNVRAKEAFGEPEEDKQLIANLRRGKIVQPFKARPEAKGYGVVVGRRRFLARKELGAKNFVVGVDCLIQEMTDEEAREASLVENLEILRKNMDPITRAHQLADLIAFSPTGLRGTARRLGLRASTLSEWLKVLDLSPKMQKALSNDHIFFTDAIHVARMELGKDLQDELAEVAKTEGLQAFKKELLRVAGGKMKRGLPKGVYIVLRTTFDKRYNPDLELYKRLESLAKTKDMKIDEYCKWVLNEYVKTVV